MLETDKSQNIIEQVQKLSKRIDFISLTKQNLIDYLLKIYVCYSQHSTNVKEDLHEFEQTLAMKEFYSIGKVEQMKKLVQNYKRYIVYIENLAKTNLSDLKTIDYFSNKQESKVKNKSKSFCKTMNEYIKSEKNYNKVYSQYTFNCKKLNDIENKSKIYSQPIYFYRFHSTSNISKMLDKKMQECENNQASLITNLQILDQKRKFLTESLREIKEEHVFLLHGHCKNIQDTCRVITDRTKDDFFTNSKSLQEINLNGGDIFQEEFQRFDDKYGKIDDNQDQMLKGLKDLFQAPDSNLHISSDFKLFLDRCETFKNKKCQSVQELLFLQKRMCEEIEKEIKNCEILQKNVQKVEKQIFKSNGMTDFKHKIKKYFGTDLLELTELCIIVSGILSRRFEKIGKIFKTHIEKLRKVVTKKDDQIKMFKKRISLILSQHEVICEQIKKHDKMNLRSVNQFKQSVKKSFQNYKNVVDEFCRSQKQIDTSYFEVLHQITTLLHKQFTHSLLGYSLNKEREKLKVEILEKINIDSLVISVVKQDTKYDVLFHDPLVPNLYDGFKSEIDKINFEETKRILKKKQFQQRNNLGEKTVGCCGITQSNKLPKDKILSEFPVQLPISDENIKKGDFKIFPKGIQFQETNKGPFSQKIQIVVPIKQIYQFNKKSKNQREGFEIMTSMGGIIFCSKEGDEILNSLQKNLGTKMILDAEKKDKDKLSESSSFYKNNTSTQFKISYEGGINHGKDFNKKNQGDSQILKQLLEQWKSKNFLSSLFTLVSNKNNKNSLARRDFYFEDDISSFLTKQKKEGKISIGLNNYFFATYQWKFSFPEMAMLKSFRHGEEIRVELGANLVKIIIIEQKHQDTHLFIRKKIYTQIEKMNKNLSDFIVEICQRQGEVIIQEQKIEQMSSLNLDTENFQERIDRQQNHRSTRDSKFFLNPTEITKL